MIYIQAMKYPCNEYNKYIGCATSRGYVRWADVVQKFAQISLLWVYSQQPALNSEENNLSNLSTVKTKHFPIGLSHITLTALLDHCEYPDKGLASSNQLWNALSPTSAIENIGKMTKDGAYNVYSTPWMNDDVWCDSYHHQWSELAYLNKGKWGRGFPTASLILACTSS